MPALGTLAIVHPAPPRSRAGNRVTALRWASILRALGWRVFVERAWSGRACDALVALHAEKSHASIRRFHDERRGKPIVVAGTGTDLYGDRHRSPAALESLELASRIVVLQRMAIDELPQGMRAKARVIVQSVRAPATRELPRPDRFEVCVLAHLRGVKDPLRAAQAARLVPEDSRLHVLLLGRALDEPLAHAAEREMRENPRFTWLGERTRAEALAILARSRFLVSSSRQEGGANVLSEALACGVPILATRIPGSMGILGADYPGLFPVGDERALAALLSRVEREPRFRSELEARCRALAPLVEPAQECASWRALLAEISLAPPARAPDRRRGPRDGVERAPGGASAALDPRAALEP